MNDQTQPASARLPKQKKTRLPESHAAPELEWLPEDVAAAASDAHDEATISPDTLGLVRTFRLKVPVADKTGRVHTSLTIVEPEQHHYALMQREGGGTKGSIAMIAALAKVPVDVIEGLRQRDHNPIKSWIEGLLDDVSAGDPKADPDAMGDQTWTCVLRASIPTDGAPVTSVTVREPNVGSGIATEKMKTEADQTAALIAQLTGHVIPVIMRMKRRDVVRIERWIAPFSTAGEDSSRKLKMLAEMFAAMGLPADGVSSLLSSHES